MNLKDINTKNIKSFFLGNLNYYLDKIIVLAPHLKEQYYYRLYKCKDTCLPKGKCVKCGCPVLKKSFSPATCNPELFPNFMSGTDWENYKTNKSINNMEEIIKEVEDGILQSGRI